MTSLGKPVTQRQLRVGELVKQNLGELFIRNEAKIPSINSKLMLLCSSLPDQVSTQVKLLLEKFFRKKIALLPS